MVLLISIIINNSFRKQSRTKKNEKAATYFHIYRLNDELHFFFIIFFSHCNPITSYQYLTAHNVLNPCILSYISLLLFMCQMILLISSLFTIIKSFLSSYSQKYFSQTQICETKCWKKTTNLASNYICWHIFHDSHVGRTQRNSFSLSTKLYFSTSLIPQ